MNYENPRNFRKSVKTHGLFKFSIKSQKTQTDTRCIPLALTHKSAGSGVSQRDSHAPD